MTYQKVEEFWGVIGVVPQTIHLINISPRQKHCILKRFAHLTSYIASIVDSFWISKDTEIA